MGSHSDHTSQQDNYFAVRCEASGISRGGQGVTARVAGVLSYLYAVASA